MSPITYQEALLMLRRAGFVKAEIDQLYRLRQAPQTSELDQPPLNLNRLLFIRWLVATGRLTDQLPKTRGAASLSSEETGSLFKTLLARFSFLLSCDQLWSFFRTHRDDSRDRHHRS